MTPGVPRVRGVDGSATTPSRRSDRSGPIAAPVGRLCRPAHPLRDRAGQATPLVLGFGVALMVLVGGYWFWFFIRVDVSAEGHSPFRIVRADLPKENSDKVFDRMRSQREQEAKEIRATGAELAQGITANADRMRTILVAEAQRDADILRGEGDAERNRIYAEAFGRDEDFFAFYRSMQAYRGAMRDDDTSMVLSPTSEFFRYFNQQSTSGQQPD